MRFYTGQHRYYCGIDLHARTMYVCVLDHENGKVVLGTIPTRPRSRIPTPSSASRPFPVSDASCPSRSSTSSTTSLASPEFRTSSPTPGW